MSIFVPTGVAFAGCYTEFFLEVGVEYFRFEDLFIYASFIFYIVD